MCDTLPLQDYRCHRYTCITSETVHTADKTYNLHLITSGYGPYVNVVQKSLLSGAGGRRIVTIPIQAMSCICRALDTCIQEFPFIHHHNMDDTIELKDIHDDGGGGVGHHNSKGPDDVDQQK